MGGGEQQGGGYAFGTGSNPTQMSPYSGGAVNLLQEQQKRTELAKSIASGFQRAGQQIGAPSAMPGALSGGMKPYGVTQNEGPALPFQPIAFNPAETNQPDLREILARIFGGAGGGFTTQGYKVQ
jgi:hypothetical protein